MIFTANGCMKYSRLFFCKITIAGLTASDLCDIIYNIVCDDTKGMTVFEV